MSFSNRCTQNVFTRRAMVKTVSRMVKKEVAAVCSNKFPSVFTNKSEEAVMSLEFNSIVKDLDSQAPTLLSLLKSCLKTKTPRGNEDVILVVIAGIIFKHRRPSCSLIQRVISLVLYVGHSAKQVRILHY